jgi:hypothetical protein
MKRTIMMVTGFVLCLVSVSSLKAQQEQPAQPVQKVWDAKKNPTVDSISAKYQGRIIASRPALTTADIFPVIGNYTSAAAVDVATTTTATTTAVDVSNVVITLDEQNKGVVWIEGLPQGRVKAMLRQSPAIYKIPAQKTEEGKEVKEGVLIYDQANNTLNICLGCEYNSENPVVAFDQTAVVAEPEVKVKKKGTKTKAVVKAKPWYFSGTKIIETTASTTESNQQ